MKNLSGFKTLGAGETWNNAVGKFFKLVDLVTALSRESGQNSSDSKLPKNKKLLLNYNLVEKSDENLIDNSFLTSLYKHASHKNSGISRSRIPNKNSNYRYLVIEDYNTDGVRGDLDFIDDEDGDSKLRMFFIYLGAYKNW